MKSASWRARVLHQVHRIEASQRRAHERARHRDEDWKVRGVGAFFIAVFHRGEDAQEQGLGLVEPAALGLDRLL